MAKKIDTINALMNTIAATVKAGCTEEQYNALRAQLNAEIVEFAVGGKIKERKGKKHAGESTVVFTSKLPTKTEVAEVATAVNNFIGSVENPYLLSLVKKEADDDSLEIPTGDVFAANVVAPEKVSNKSLRNAIVGTNGISFIQMKLSGLDVITLAGIGEKARTRAMITTGIIAGSVTLALAAGALTWYLVAKKNNDAEDVCEEPVTDVDADEAPEVELD